MTPNLTGLPHASLKDLGPETIKEVRTQTCDALTAGLKDSKSTKFPVVDCSSLATLAPDDLINALQSAKFGAPRLLILPGSMKPDTSRTLADFEARVAKTGKHVLFYTQGDNSDRSGRLIEFMQRLDNNAALKAHSGKAMADGLRTLIYGLQRNAAFVDGTALKDDFPGALLAQSNLTAPVYLVDMAQPTDARLSMINKADLGKCKAAELQKLSLEPGTWASLSDCLAGKANTLNLSCEAKLDKLPGALIDALKPKLKLVTFSTASPQTLRAQFNGIQQVVRSEADRTPASNRSSLGNKTLISSTDHIRQNLKDTNHNESAGSDVTIQGIVTVQTGDGEETENRTSRETRSASTDTLVSRGQPDGGAHDAGVKSQVTGPSPSISSAHVDATFNDDGASKTVGASAPGTPDPTDASAKGETVLHGAPSTHDLRVGQDTDTPPVKKRNFVTRIAVKIGEYFASFWRLLFGARATAQEQA